MAIALSVAYLATPLATGAKLKIFATDQVSAGVNRPASRSYRLIAVTAAAAASPANILTAYTAKFGALISGKKIFVRGVVTSSVGIDSVAFESSIVVT